MIFCGIDPGISGAIGFIDEQCRFIAVVDMPILPMTTGRYSIDPAQLAEVLRKARPDFVMVERVGPRPGNHLQAHSVSATASAASLPCRGRWAFPMT